MEGTYGMVHTMKRTYKNHKAACDAGVRRAKSTHQPAYVGMLLDCRFHITDTNPRGDWRWDVCMICQPDGKVSVQH